MKSVSIILFVIGILVVVLAFLGDRADYIPFVLEVFSLDHIKAKKGVRLLTSKQVLSPGDIGYEQLSALCLKMLKTTPPEAKANIKVLKIRCGKTILKFDKGKVLTNPVLFDLSVGKTVHWDLSSLRAEVNSLKGKRLFIVALILFSIGLIIQIAGFVIGLRNKPEAQSVQPHMRTNSESTDSRPQ